VTRLTNDTSLTWTLGPAAAGYEIVWRPTTSPVWTHAVPVGRVATATLKGFSKNNALIGLRAVGAGAKHSPAVLPSRLPGPTTYDGIVPDVWVGSAQKSNANVGDYLSNDLPETRHRSDRLTCREDGWR
jgi:hypothetical protein